MGRSVYNKDLGNLVSYQLTVCFESGSLSSPLSSLSSLFLSLSLSLSHTHTQLQERVKAWYDYALSQQINLGKSCLLFERGEGMRRERERDTSELVKVKSLRADLKMSQLATKCLHCGLCGQNYQKKTILLGSVWVLQFISSLPCLIIPCLFSLMHEPKAALSFGLALRTPTGNCKVRRE